MDEPTAWTVPGYAAEQLIGFGATGEVWRGRSLRTGEQVALKRLRTADATTAGAVRSPGAPDLRREAALLAAMDHPHVLRIREVVGGRQTVLVLDYAAGGSLAMLLRRRGRLRPGEVVTVLAPLAAALAYAHGEGLTHGDVSPANVLFDADGRPLLADLGVARVTGERPDPRTTPDYVDPAVAAGAAAGPASDVFMLAGIALHALTGTPPWPAATAEESVAAASRGELPDLRPLVAVAPPALARVLRRALSPRPDERGTAAELALDMRHACQPEPISLTGQPDDGAARGQASGDPPAAGAWPPPDPHSAGAPPLAALTHVVRLGSAARGEPEGGDPAGPRHRRRPVTPQAVAGPGRPLRWAAAGISVLLLAALAGVGWASAGPATRPAGSGASAPVTGPSAPGLSAPASTAAADPPAAAPGASWSPRQRRWLGLLDALDAVRARAYDQGDVDLLRSVYAAGDHLAADTRQLRSLVDAGETVSGVRHRFRAVTVLADDGRRGTLRVVQSLPASVRVRAGRAVGAVSGTPDTTIVVDLVRTSDGWRLA